MNAPLEHIELVEGSPRTRNGNVKVRMIAQKHLIAGETLAEIAEHYGITLSDVHAAMSYYYDNQAEFERQYREIEAQLEAAKRDSAERLARLRTRAALQEHE